MGDKQVPLREFPKVDEVLQDERLVLLYETMPKPLIMDTARETVGDVRNGILEDTMDRGLSQGEITDRITGISSEKRKRTTRRVFNITGAVLHTNLGRARLSSNASGVAWEIMGAYCTLEYGLKSGTGGSHHTIVEGIIKKVIGAEVAMVVNSNATATMLALAAPARGREMVVSRGELVEAGGSFRVPSVTSESGAFLKKVGTTNKARVSDYRSAYKEGVMGYFMKIHASSYRIMGFTEDVRLG